MTTGIRIRALRLSDYDDMIEIFRVCGLPPRVRGRDGREAIARQLRAFRGLYLGAFDGDRLVGTVLGTHDLRRGWINRVAVRPEYRRQGLASKLVRACEQELRKRGLEIFAALVDDDNGASRHLFGTLGYEDRNVGYLVRKLREEI